MINPSVSIKLEVKQSDIPVKGNVMVSGDSAYDRKVENEILKRLNDGDIAAWFDALVTVCIEWDDSEFTYEYEGTDSLGCCNYASIQQFVKQSGGYFEDMIDQAWDSAVIEAKNDGVTEDIAKPDLSKIKPVICY